MKQCIPYIHSCASRGLQARACAHGAFSVACYFFLSWAHRALTGTSSDIPNVSTVYATAASSWHWYSSGRTLWPASCCQSKRLSTWRHIIAVCTMHTECSCTQCSPAGSPASCSAHNDTTDGNSLVRDALTLPPLYIICCRSS